MAILPRGSSKCQGTAIGHGYPGGLNGLDQIELETFYVLRGYVQPLGRVLCEILKVTINLGDLGVDFCPGSRAFDYIVCVAFFLGIRRL